MLSLDAPPHRVPLDLDVFAGPPSQGVAAARPRPMSTFNPSIAPAPPSLCRRCAFVATRASAIPRVRVAALLRGRHRGRAAGQVGVGAWFKGTALVSRRELRDARLDLAARLPGDLAADRTRRAGGTCRSAPPAARAAVAAPVYDARIFNFEALFSSQVCKACDFSTTQLRLAADPTADGGVANLQAWATQRFVVREGWPPAATRRSLRRGRRRGRRRR